MKYLSFVTLVACVFGIIFSLIVGNYLAAIWATIAFFSTANVCLRQNGYR